MPNRSTSPKRRPQGQTLPMQEQAQQKQERVPRAPHERDESADSQAQAEPSAGAVGKLAHDDLAQGRQDTDKGPVMDAVYGKVRAGAPKPAGKIKPAAGRASRR